MQISRAIITGGVASPDTQQITSSTAASSVPLGGSLSIAVSTMGFNTGDIVYWQSTGTTANSTGSAVVTNTLGIIGSANLSITTSGSDNGTFNVFILNSQISGSILRRVGPISFLGLASTYGWFAGGTGPTSIVDRIDFANDSPTAASRRGPLNVARYQLAAVGNANYGWFAAGKDNSGPGITSYVDRVDFANDSPTTASLRGPLSSSSYGLAATGNANYGWFAGGSPGPLSQVSRIDYSNDSPTTASPRGPLSAAKGYLAATGNTNYGWFGGGTNSTPAVLSTVDRIDFANDSPTVASVRGRLSIARGTFTAVANANYGWFGGGFAPGVPGNYSIVDRIDFANDSPTSASPRGPLSQSSAGNAAAGNANYGWFAVGSGISSVNRIDFANDSPAAASPRGPLSSARYYLAASSNYSGGVQTAPIKSAGTYGWFLGGGSSVPAAVSTVDRIDFANDSPTSASPRGALAAAAYDAAGVGNANYAWHVGGPTPWTNSVFRVDYANDNAVATTRGLLTTARYRASASSNANYGWISGGFAGYSTIDRIDFANDSPTSSSPRGNLSIGRRAHGATGNANYGWHAGAGTSGTDSSVDRIDYANDSPTSTSPRGPLSSGRQYIYASGNANYGWFNGYGGSKVDRIDFSNDSPTSASLRGLLSFNAGLFSGSTSNANYGWWCGGGSSSAVTRIDFANDSPTTSSTRGPLSIGRGASAAASNYTK
jgi:hypothetical protein